MGSRIRERANESWEPRAVYVHRQTNFDNGDDDDEEDYRGNETVRANV